MPWTEFWDMHSGGGQKLEWPLIFIEAPEAEAISVFWARFHRNPHRITCTCCGEDYSVSETETLVEAQKYKRPEELASALYITADTIKPEERHLKVPTEGYVWKEAD